VGNDPGRFRLTGNPHLTRRWPLGRAYQAAFSLVYRVGIENEKIDKNPASGIRRKTENNARVRFLTNEEEKALRSAILLRFAGFIHQLDLSLHRGMRAAKQFSLKWDQVDFERKTLTLPKTKNGTMHHIRLNAVAIAALNALKTAGKGTDDGLVFPSHRKPGMRLQGPRGWFNEALKDAKITGYTWHCNRHTFASRLVMSGTDIVTVGKLLGHKSHLAPAHNAAAVDRLVSFSDSEMETQLAPQLAPLQ
jgi:integrase